MLKLVIFINQYKRSETRNVKRIRIYGAGTALSSIIHGEVMDQDWKKNAPEGAPKPQRTEWAFLKIKDADGQELGKTRVSIPFVSGNSFRGIQRRLINAHTNAVLGTDIVDLFPKASDGRKVMFSLNNGGLSPKGYSAIPAKTNDYIQAKKNIPVLAALGTVFGGHHFDGDANIDGLLPYLNEIKFRYEKDFHPELIKALEKESMPLSEFLGYDYNVINHTPSSYAIRYTRRAEVGCDDEEEKDATKDPEAMIYGMEYIPMGTTLAHSGTMVTNHDGAAIAFRAMYALMMEHGIVGGMSGRGHGIIDFNFYIKENGQIEELIPEKEIALYDDYILAHKDEILTTIQKMPTIFKTVKKVKEKSKTQEGIA